MQVDVRDTGSFRGSGRFPGGGHSNPPQYSCLENPMDRGAWQATVHRVAQSQTSLKWLSTYVCTPPLGMVWGVICRSITNAHHYFILLAFPGSLHFLISRSKVWLLLVNEMWAVKTSMELKPHDHWFTCACEQVTSSFRLTDTMKLSMSFLILTFQDSEHHVRKWTVNRRGGEKRFKRDCGDSVKHMGEEVWLGFPRAKAYTSKGETGVNLLIITN